MIPTRGFGPLRPRNFADGPSYPSSVSGLAASSIEQTPNPRRALLPSYTQEYSGAFPSDSENVDPLADSTSSTTTKNKNAYEAEYTYNTLHLQKLQGQYQSMHTKPGTVRSQNEAAQSLQRRLRALITEEEQVRLSLQRSQTHSLHLRDSFLKTQQSLLCETEINTKLTHEVGKLKAEKIKLEANIAHIEEKAAKMKEILEKCADGQNNQKSTILELEKTLRELTSQKHSLERELNQQKMTLQTLKTELIHEKQRLCGIQFAKKEAENIQKSDLYDLKSLESRLSAELVEKRGLLDEVLLEDEEVYESFEHNQVYCAYAKTSMSEKKRFVRRMKTVMGILCVVCFFLGLFARFMPGFRSSVG